MCIVLRLKVAEFNKHIYFFTRDLFVLYAFHKALVFIVLFFFVLLACFSVGLFMSGGYKNHLKTKPGVSLENLTVYVGPWHLLRYNTIFSIPAS